MPNAPLSPPVPRWADPPPQGRFGVDDNDISLVSLWRILLRRRRILFAVLVCALLAGLFLATRPRKYLASGTLQVRAGTTNRFRYQNNDVSPADMDIDDRIESEVSVLESKSLYAKVAEQLHLASNPAVAGKEANPHASMDDPAVQARVLGAMTRMIKVERIPKTETITISCTSTSPLLSMQIVSTLMNQYVERIFTTQFSSTQRAGQFLSTQLNDLKNQILADQQKLVDLQSRLGVVGFDDTHNIVTAQLEDLAKANEQANIARITAEACYRILQDERPDLVEGGPPLLSSATQGQVAGSLLQTLRAAEAQLQSQYANVSEQFGPNYPETKRLRAELAEATAAVGKEQARVLEQAKIAYEAAANNQRMTESALRAAQTTASEKRNDMVQYEILLHDYQSSRTLYEGLTQRLREAGVVSGLESGEIELVDLPTLPVTPTGYGRLALLAISLALGLVLGFIVAMLVEATDTSVHSVDELEREMGLPSFAVLPSFEGKGSGPGKMAGSWEGLRNSNAPPEQAGSRGPSPGLEVLRAPLSPFTEGIRLLRSSLLLAQPGHPPRSVMFTSAMPQEGKSTVCANLACVLAQSGARVLLVDVDLRRPTQHRRFGVSNRKGLSSVLTGTATLEACVHVTSAAPTLFLLTSGPPAPSPGQLIASEVMRSLIASVSAQYEFVVVDAPPGLAISDASTLASMVETVLLVVRDGVANRKMIARVSGLLRRVGAHLPGFVFNGVRKNSVEYHEYGGRDGYYGYERYAEQTEADAL